MENLSRSAFKFCLLAAGLALVNTASADSLWKPGISGNQVTDKTARAVGDLLTVVVFEKNVINKSAKSETKKESADDAKIENFLYGTNDGSKDSQWLKHKGAYPAMKFSLSNQFKGEGSVANSDDISATFTVRVIDVLPNGNLIIEGMRRTAYVGEIQDIVLRGTVRKIDITGQNKVNSNQVADLSLRYINTGEITDGQRKGWFKKFWDSVSPF
ncbi:MAG: flagellar basal body L-ring protein FlgH [Verrucomicrobiota bacterium]|jgi:flagellar L-ring protein precursor FlgH|nr:flagellar basal body L-ring protein FlgH [Verrucomicrobiota bacterium]